MRALCYIAGVFLTALHPVGPDHGASLDVAARLELDKTQEAEERPAVPRTIPVDVRAFQRAVNGKASVRNTCRAQAKESEIEETTEVVETDRCKLILKTIKTTRTSDARKEGPVDRQSAVEFTIYADMSELTTPVLVEPQKFSQCEAGGVGVLKVSSRSDPKHPIQVLRRSQSTKPSEGTKQLRRDLSLFFTDPKAAKRAADTLDRAIKACGGKEWPDEDDLP